MCQHKVASGRIDQVRPAGVSKGLADGGMRLIGVVAIGVIVRKRHRGAVSAKSVSEVRIRLHLGVASRGGTRKIGNEAAG